MDKKTLWEYKNVSQSIKPSARAEQLSYTHHREVASLPPNGSTRSTRTEQPLPLVAIIKLGTLMGLQVTNRRKVGMTSSPHGPYDQGFTRHTMVGTEG